MIKPHPSHRQLGPILPCSFPPRTRVFPQPFARPLHHLHSPPISWSPSGATWSVPEAPDTWCRSDTPTPPPHPRVYDGRPKRDRRRWLCRSIPRAGRLCRACGRCRRGYHGRVVAWMLSPWRWFQGSIAAAPCIGRTRVSSDYTWPAQSNVGSDAVGRQDIPSSAHFLIILPFYFRQRCRCNDNQWDPYQRPCLCEHVLKSRGQIILLVFR